MKLTFFIPTERRMTWEMDQTDGPLAVMIRTRDTASGAVVMRGKRVPVRNWTEAAQSWFELARQVMPKPATEGGAA